MTILSFQKSYSSDSTRNVFFTMFMSFSTEVLWLHVHIGNWTHIREIATSMMTSSNGNIFRVAGPLCGEFTGPGEFPAQRPVTRSFDVFFDLRLNKRLSKQPWVWWFETPSWSLWRQCNGVAWLCADSSPGPLTRWNHCSLHTDDPGPRLIIKTIFPRYRDSHVKDKMVVRPSYL